MNIWIFRHGKSSWAESAQRDFDRPLAERGHADGEAAATWLSSQRDLPQWLYVSDARRTQETAVYIRRGIGLNEVSLHLEHRLYLASAETLLDLVRSTPEEIRSVGLIGHNPSSTQFINLMTGREVIDHLPTLGIAVLNIANETARFLNRIEPGQAELERIMTPKRLRRR